MRIDPENINPYAVDGQYDKIRPYPGLVYAVFLVILGASLLQFFRGESNADFIASVNSACFFVFATLYLLISMNRQIKYRPYAYNTIYYAGFALFVFSMAVTFIILSVYLFRQPEYFGEPFIYATRLLESAARFIMMTSPFLVIFSVAMIISNIQLIRKEGFRSVNVLGIILASMLMAGIVFQIVYNLQVQRSHSVMMIHEIISHAFSTVFLYFECLLIGTIISNFIALKFKVPDDLEAVIVLGCAMRRDGTPTPLLAGRCDKAMELYREQCERTGRSPLIVASGGQGADEIMSEAECMKNYIVSSGIPEKDVFVESRSMRTSENMLFSKEIIDVQRHLAEKENNNSSEFGKAVKKDKYSSRMVFATTNYHVFRSGIIASDCGMKIIGQGAKTKWYFWPNAAVREFAGLLVRQRKKQAFILSAMIAVYVLYTIAFYSMY